MTRYVHVIYCDDVRQEVGNKTSFIGVYGADLFVAEFPVALPKLAIVVTLVTDAAEPFQTLSVTLFRGEDPITEFAIPPADLARAIQAAQAPSPTENSAAVTGTSLIAFNAIFSVAPFPIEKPTILRVIVRTESGELRGPGLKIGLFPKAELADEPIVAENSVH